MQTISAPLFEGQLIRLTPVDHEADPETVAAWTHNDEFMRLYSPQPVRPLTVEQVKKKFEQIDKEMDEDNNLFHFAIRPHDEQRLIGEARLQWIEWTNGNAWVKLGIPNPQDRHHGYGSEALRLLMRFAFRELNLYRLTISLPEYNARAIAFFEKAGFIVEVRRREAINRMGRRWDLIDMGILLPEWEARHAS